jgi:hypothetical protein
MEFRSKTAEIDHIERASPFRRFRSNYNDGSSTSIPQQNRQKAVYGGRIFSQFGSRYHIVGRWPPTHESDRQRLPYNFKRPVVPVVTVSTSFSDESHSRELDPSNRCPLGVEMDTSQQATVTSRDKDSLGGHNGAVSRRSGGWSKRPGCGPIRGGCGTGGRCKRQPTVWLAPALLERCNASY